jgi:hypothetical protein
MSVWQQGLHSLKRQSYSSSSSKGSMDNYSCR